MRPLALLPLAAFVAGAALIADAVRRGEATLALVVVVPVVAGSSGEFLLGVVLVLVGFLSLPLLFLEARAPVAPLPAEPPRAEGGSAGVGGGFVLIGPVPIFFGGFRRLSRRVRLGIAVAAVLLFALSVAFFAGALR